MAEDEEPETMTLREAARELGMSYEGVRHWTKVGYLRVVRRADGRARPVLVDAEQVRAHADSRA